MFLEKILAEKQKEVTRLKQNKNYSRVEGGGGFTQTSTRRSLAQALKSGQDGFGFIAEVKKASPSQGVIRQDFDPVALARDYEAAGAQAISVLTDQTFFQGKLHFLQMIREEVALPLLRKDFIIDRAQVDESVAAGADAILLIAAALDRLELIDLCRYAQERGLEVLLEIHTPSELPAALAAKPDVLGINNRNLYTFEVSLDVTRELVPHIPNDVPVISESGISHPRHVQELRQLGLAGMLVGEFLMRQQDVKDGMRYLRGAS